MSIRVIYDYNLYKLKIQYEIIKNMLPKHELYIYKNEDINLPKNKVKYNIYIDTISEYLYKNLKCKYTILIVNELYIKNKYLRRENYIDKPLKKLIKVVDYYFCFTKQNQKKLIKKNINNEKIIYFNNIIKFKKQTTKIVNKKYILFDIDAYSYKKNNILLNIWLKYYLDSNYILIIYIKNVYDKILHDFLTLIKKTIVSYNDSNVYTYQNIIITSNQEEINQYDYFAVILNVSDYSLYTMLSYYLLKNKIIIINNNKITERILKNKNNINNILLYSDFKKINEKIDLLENIDYYPNNVINKDNITKLLLQFKFMDTTPIIYNDITMITNKITNIELFKQSYDKMSKIIDTIDSKVQNKNINFKEYYTWLKHPKNKSNYCYATLICINNTYLCSILATGYKLKQITNHNIICFVQHKPYYEDNKLKFIGLTANEINEIKKIYDAVIGINILDSKYKNTNIIDINYRYSFYYCTKIICFGFIAYSKMFYFDASVIINHNIDKLFSYEKSIYLCLRNIKGELHGACLYIIPKLYYIQKIIYLLEHYEEIFIKNKFSSFCNFDEDLIFYTIYPNWETHNLKNILNIGENTYRKQYIDFYELRYNFSIEIYAILKPFRYSTYLKETERDYFNLNHTCYFAWDEIVRELLIVYPKLKKYFKYIKTFRNTLF